MGSIDREFLKFIKFMPNRYLELIEENKDLKAQNERLVTQALENEKKNRAEKRAKDAEIRDLRAQLQGKAGASPRSSSEDEQGRHVMRGQYAGKSWMGLTSPGGIPTKVVPTPKGNGHSQAGVVLTED